MADGPIWWPKPPGRPTGSPAPYWNLELGTSADSLPTFVVTHQLQVERRTGKVRQSETDVLPLCHATNFPKKVRTHVQECTPG